MLGVLERVEEKRSQRGDGYWTLIISGRKYTVWERKLVTELQPGDAVEFSYTQSGQFRKILDLRKSSPHNLNRWLDHQDERGRRIARMSCLRTAAQILDGKRLGNLKRAELVMQIARFFEEHILGEQQPPDPARKVKA